ncbi:MAG: hypothetical protein FJW23_07340 [Acidimicrobiia bacterium]|nr:hypothetical protein [Acidimicrobiia bacterium]
MSHSAEDVREEVRTYITVFAALLVLTVVTVAVSYIHIDSMAGRVLVALIVASAKASLVGLFFMHLKGERPMVYISLAFTAVFFVTIFALPMWTEGDHIIGTHHQMWDAGVEAPTMPEDTH